MGKTRKGLVPRVVVVGEPALREAVGPVQVDLQLEAAAQLLVEIGPQRLLLVAGVGGDAAVVLDQRRDVVPACSRFRRSRWRWSRTRTACAPKSSFSKSNVRPGWNSGRHSGGVAEDARGPRPASRRSGEPSSLARSVTPNRWVMLNCGLPDLAPLGGDDDRRRWWPWSRRSPRRSALQHLDPLDVVGIEVGDAVDRVVLVPRVAAGTGRRSPRWRRWGWRRC